MSSVPVDGVADDLAAGVTSRLVLVCQGCGDAEAVLECECCGEHLCEVCWGEGDPFCQECMGEEELGRPVEKVHVRGDYL